MKIKRFSIAAILFASIMMLVHFVVPHHHHLPDGANSYTEGILSFCVSTESHCDDTSTDNITTDNASSGECEGCANCGGSHNGCDDSCVARLPFMLTRATVDNCCDDHCNGCHAPEVAVITPLYIIEVSIESLETNILSQYAPYLEFHYTSPTLTDSALRAPPVTSLC